MNMDESTNDNAKNKGLSDIYKIFKEIFIKAPPVLQDLSNMSIEIDYKEYINVRLDFIKINQNFQEEKYSSITDAIKDIRLVFLNCYKFYGALSDYTKESLKLEEQLEQKLSCLDDDFKPLCDIKVTLNSLGVKKNSNYKFKYPKDLYDSILLRYVAHCRSERLKEYHKLLSSKLTTDEDKAHTLDEILSWEKEIFFNDNYRCISSMPELPEIGNFVSIIFKELNFDMVNQGEIERMFLMPRESITMSKIMTTLLMPIKKFKDINQIMPYIIWSAKLRNKVSEWYKVYHMKKRNKVRVMTLLGIHPDYWAAVGDKNPLLEYDYYILPYFIKVWLVKGLCDYVINKYKTINYIITNCNERQCTIWKNDLETEEYFYFNSMPDLRIYYSNIPYDEPSLEFLDLEKNDNEVNEEEASSLIGVSSSFRTNSRVKPNEKCFKLIADSVQGLRSFLNELYTDDTSVPESLINAFEDLIVKIEPNEYNLIVLNNNSKIKLFKDWKSYTERSQKDKDTLLFWEEKELKSVTSKSSSSNEIIFEKRKSKTVLKEGFDSSITFDSDEYISESENENYNFTDSDDEWGALNQPKSRAKQSVQAHSKFDELEKRLKVENKLIKHQTNNMLNSSNKKKSHNILIKKHDKLIDNKKNENEKLVCSINIDTGVIKTEKVLSIKSKKEENKNEPFFIKNNNFTNKQQYDNIESIIIDDENDFTSKQPVAKKRQYDILKDADIDIDMIDDDDVNDCNITNVNNLSKIMFHNSGEKIGEINKHNTKNKPSKFNSNNNDEVISVKDVEEIIISDDDDIEFVSITKKSSNASIKINSSFSLNKSQSSTPRNGKMGITNTNQNTTTKQQVTASITIPKLSPNISIIPANVNVPKGIQVTMVKNPQPIIPSHFNAIKRLKLPPNHQTTNSSDVIVKCKIISKPSLNGEVKFYISLPIGQLHPVSDELANQYLKEHNNSLPDYLYVPLPIDVAKKYGYN